MLSARVDLVCAGAGRDQATCNSGDSDAGIRACTGNCLRASGLYTSARTGATRLSVCGVAGSLAGARGSAVACVAAAAVACVRDSVGVCVCAPAHVRASARVRPSAAADATATSGRVAHADVAATGGPAAGGVATATANGSSVSPRRGACFRACRRQAHRRHHDL